MKPTGSSVTLRLDERAQFIHELVLAEMELRTAGARFEVNENLRSFAN